MLGLRAPSTYRSRKNNGDVAKFGYFVEIEKYSNRDGAVFAGVGDEEWKKFGSQTSLMKVCDRSVLASFCLLIEQLSGKEPVFVNLTVFAVLLNYL
jgi:hypothetical protein